MATETKLLLIITTSILALPATTFAADIGVNWGTQMSHPLNPSIVVKMLKANGIKKVKLFDADEWTMKALAGSGLEVMIGIPNFDLERMSEKLQHAEEWVKENVTAYDHDGGVNIKYVAVGNEAFLTSYNGVYLKTTLPAMKNVQRALNDAGVGDRIKVVTPLNADVYGSPPHDPVPSAGDFRSDIHSLMLDVVKFLHQNKSPFVVNIYPFLSLQQNEDFPVDFAFFDGGNRSIDDKGKQYENVFDANYDTLTWALKKAGVGDMKIVVGEAGWPTDGDKNANVEKAKRFYDGFLKNLAAKKGTPLRPGEDMDVYLFGLLDENMKSILPGNFERHWGLFRYDGQPKFPLDLSLSSHPKLPIAAEGVEYLPAQWCILNPESNPNSDRLAADLDYACNRADCTRLLAGGSCQNLDRSKKPAEAPGSNGCVPLRPEERPRAQSLHRDLRSIAKRAATRAVARAIRPRRKRRSKWCVLKPGVDANSDRIAGQVDFACKHADCAPIRPGGACKDLERSKYVSYAFNAYFQMKDQDVKACDFDGQAEIVKVNPSVDGCLFLEDNAGEKMSVGVLVVVMVVAVVTVLV